MIIFNRAPRRRLNWLAQHTTPVEGKQGKVESKPRSPAAFQIGPNTHPSKVQRWMRRGGRHWLQAPQQAAS